MESLLDRFCRYVRIDTQADEKAATYPSSPGQLELGRLLVRELLSLGVRDAAVDQYGIVLGTIPATAPLRKATSRVFLLLVSAAFAVRILPATAIIMPLKPAM